MNDQPPQPTLAEIVAGLREQANWDESLHTLLCKIGHQTAAPSSIALLRAAADRLEGLAKLTGDLRESEGEIWLVDFGNVADWFAARDRLLK